MLTQTVVDLPRPTSALLASAVSQLQSYQRSLLYGATFPQLRLLIFARSPELSQFLNKAGCLV